jgi:CubicO group peptidase (beta-lactamase class C family)
MHRRTLLVSVLVSLCAVVACQEQERSDPVEEEFALTLNTYIEAVMETFEIPGLTIAVTRGGEVVYIGAFGVRSLDSGEPMKAE